MTAHPSSSPLSFLGAVGLVAGPLLLLAGFATDPIAASGYSNEVTALAAHPQQGRLSITLSVIAMLLLIPGAVALAQLAAARAPRLAAIGGALAVLGAAIVAGLFMTSYWELAIATSLSPRAAGALARAADEQSVITALALPGLMLGFIGGFSTLAIALRRTGLVPLHVPILTTLGAVGLLAADGQRLTGIGATALLTVGLGSVGCQLLARQRATDNEIPQTTHAVPRRPRISLRAERP